MVSPLIDLLVQNPLLTLFLVTGSGYLLGRVRIRNFSLGISAILFAGLAVGALDPDLRLPNMIYQFGLVLFVYTLGLASGPSLLGSFRRRGVRDTLFAVASLTGASALTLLVGKVLRLPGPILAGIFAGGLTSTPALAAVLDYVAARSVGSPDVQALLSQPVVGYSLTYPMGIVGVMVSMHIMAKLWRVDFEAESSALGHGAGDRITSADIEVTEPTAVDQPIRLLFPSASSRVVVSRLLRGHHQMTVDGNTSLLIGDIVTLVGPDDEISRFTPLIGRPSAVQPQLDRTELDVATVFVSNSDVAGRRLKDLRVRRFGAVVSRIRRGNVELLARGDSVLELGDQLRIVGPRDRLADVSSFFGDSFKNLGEVNVVSISLGIGLGLLVGLIPIPLFGGITFRLGYAAGPLLVALVLGMIGRTRKLVWALPYNANLTLRQLGLVLFLAGIGTQAGIAFGGTLTELGIVVMLAGAAITLLYSALTLFIGYKVLRIPMTILYGLMAGIQTQSATLAFANERIDNDVPNISYATVYPTAMVIKILLVQILVSFFGIPS